MEQQMLTKPPSKIISNHFKPSGYMSYKVKDGDSWETLAREYNMKPWELIYNNFQTRDAEEVNWYLKKYVGCTKVTEDNKNLIFRSADQPGVIYLPPKKVHVPPTQIESKPNTKLKKIWAGLAKVHSGDLFIVGAHDLTGVMYNLGDDIPDVRNVTININGYKFGPGLGASIGAAFVFAHGYEFPKEMNGVSGGWDFDVAIGAKLGDILKGVKGLGSVVDTIEKYKKLRYLTESTIKNLGIVKPGIYTIPIPLAGVGLHLWGGYKFGNVKVMSEGKGIY